ncbi:MAG: biotin/lipoyl-binding protein [bacterium]|nr:MAG: biotin/lipoyl-binding protein [bacterium]
MGFVAIIDGQKIPVGVTTDSEGRTVVTVEDREYVVDSRWTQMDLLSLLIDGQSYQVDIHSEKDCHRVLIEGEHFDFELFDERKTLLKSAAGLGAEGVQEIKTSMPGKIVKILVSEGDEVQQGDGLVIVEAMKMENEMKSPKAGVVKRVGIKEGEAVESGAVLVVVE